MMGGSRKHKIVLMLFEGQGAVASCTTYAWSLSEPMNRLPSLCHSSRLFEGCRRSPGVLNTLPVTVILHRLVDAVPAT